MFQASELFLSVPRKVMITTETAKSSVLGKYTAFVIYFVYSIGYHIKYIIPN